MVSDEPPGGSSLLLKKSSSAASVPVAPAAGFQCSITRRSACGWCAHAFPSLHRQPVVSPSQASADASADTRTRCVPRQASQHAAPHSSQVGAVPSSASQRAPHARHSSFSPAPTQARRPQAKESSGSSRAIRRRGGGGGGGGGNASPISGRSVSSPRSFSSMAGALGFRRGFREGVLMACAQHCLVRLPVVELEPSAARRRN